MTQTHVLLQADLSRKLARGVGLRFAYADGGYPVDPAQIRLLAETLIARADEFEEVLRDYEILQGVLSILDREAPDVVRLRRFDPYVAVRRAIELDAEHGREFLVVSSTSAEGRIRYHALDSQIYGSETPGGQLPRVWGTREEGQK